MTKPGGRIDVGNPAEKVLAVRQSARDVDVRAVSRAATNVRNQVPGAIELRADVLGASRPQYSM